MRRKDNEDGKRLKKLGICESSFGSKNLSKDNFDLLSSTDACSLLEAINIGDHNGDDINQAFEDALSLIKQRGGIEKFTFLLNKCESVERHGLQEILNNIPKPQQEEAQDNEYDDQYNDLEDDLVQKSINDLDSDEGAGDYDAGQYESEMSGDSDQYD